MAYYNSGNSLQRDSPIVFNLIIINVLVYIAQLFAGDAVTNNIALYPVQSGFFKPYQVVTHMFAHSPNLYVHILFNMLALWMFGSPLEKFLGSKRFLILYLASGLGAAALHLTMEYIRFPELAQFNEETYNQFILENGMIPRYVFGGAAVGASGAVMGVMAAFAYFFPNTKLYMFLIPLPIKAKIAIPIMVAIDLFGGFAKISNDNIAHFAHLGGAVTGFLFVFIMNRTNKKTFY